MFLVTDPWQEAQLNRKVFKFRLELDALELNLEFASEVELETTRIIASTVKLEVHYDHDVPYSKGGSSLTAKNIRLLCARHNRARVTRSNESFAGRGRLNCAPFCFSPSPMSL
jgi:hypothetical protein